MKYVRKITALVLAIIFCAAIVIGLGVIYSVQNVNVEFRDYTGKYGAEFEKTKENLSRLKGTGIFFISDKDLTDRLSDSTVLAVESYERVYPCSVNVKIKERVECFTVQASADVASVYDDDGVFMYTARTDGGEYLNPSDNSPNITVGTAGDGYLTAQDYKCVAALCKEIKSSFKALRKIVDSVTVYVSLNTANVKFKSGVSIVVSDWQVNVKNKIERVCAVYETLSDKQRTCGMITVADGPTDTQPTARYSQGN